MNSQQPHPFQFSEILSRDLNREYRRKILITVAGIGAVVSLIFSAVIWTLYQNIFSALTDSFYALAYLWTLRWIQRDQYTLSAYWIIFWTGMQVTWGTILFVGPETGFQLYALALPVMIYLFLWDQPRWAKAIVGLYGCLSLILCQVIDIQTYRAPIPAHFADAIFIFNALIVFGIIFAALRLFGEELESAYQKQQSLVQIDSLTQLYNDRFVAQHASKLLSLCDRYGHPFSLILIHIDYLKRLNELYGNDTGNEAIIHIAKQLSEDVRDADILARVGGNEFVILLPETQLEDATDIAKRLHEDISNKPLKHKKQGIALSVSYGISACDSNAMSTIDQLFADANSALEKTKNAK